MASSKIPPWLRPTRPGPDWRAYEVEVLPGLEPIAAAELRERLGAAARVGPPAAPAACRSRCAATPRRCSSCARPWPSTASSASTSAARPSCSPRRTWRACSAAVGAVVERPAGRLRDAAPLGRRRRLARLHAAGRPAPRRLPTSAGSGRAATSSWPSAAPTDEGWEALVRLTPRPLSARPWRVCNLPGALDATAAHAMARLSAPLQPTPGRPGRPSASSTWPPARARCWSSGSRSARPRSRSESTATRPPSPARAPTCDAAGAERRRSSRPTWPRCRSRIAASTAPSPTCRTAC